MIQLFLLLAALAGYLIAAIAALRIAPQPPSRRAPALRLTVISSTAGIASHVGFVIARTVANGFLPFASRFEALLLFSLAIESAGLILFLRHPLPRVKFAADTTSTMIVGTVLVLFGLPRSAVLNPILNSPFFVFHILTAFAGYGTLVTGFLASLFAARKREGGSSVRVLRQLALATLLLLGIGILSGAAWADISWGKYWSWDPKEAWALFTWSVMLLFVHTYHPRSSRWVPALFFTIGVLAMLFTFIGINLLRWGMHRYI